MSTVEEHAHNFPPSQWPFTDPVNALAISTRQVIHEGHPIRRVSHDTDGDWQVLCGTTTDVADALVVCLGCAYELDPSLAALADLPRGWTAWRDQPGDDWQRERNDDDSDS